MTRQRTFFEDGTQRKRTAGGIATANVVMSAKVGENWEMFPDILALHVPVGAEIADVTYGKGVFWKAWTEASTIFTPRT